MKKDNLSSKNDHGSISLHEHEYIDEVVKPTCTEKGFTLHKCKYCEYQYKDNFTDASHDYEIIEDIPATCTDSGKKTLKCKTCGKEIVNTIEPLKHSFSSWFETIKPTCTTEGVLERECVICNKIETKKTNKLEHQFTEWKVDENNPKIKTRYCQNCGIEEKINTKQKNRYALLTLVFSLFFIIETIVLSILCVGQIVSNLFFLITIGIINVYLTIIVNIISYKSLDIDIRNLSIAYEICNYIVLIILISLCIAFYKSYYYVIYLSIDFILGFIHIELITKKNKKSNQKLEE